MVDRSTNEEVGWAAGYNGYQRLASSSEQLSAIIAPARAEYRRDGVVPDWCGVDLLRGWAFLLFREDYFAGGGTLRTEWEAVLAAVTAHPHATPTDLPPGEVVGRAPQSGVSPATRATAHDLGGAGGRWSGGSSDRL